MPVGFLLTVLLGTSHATTLPAGPAVDFGRDIYGVLQKACFECHGPDRQEAQLRLDRAEDLAASGTAVPGRPQSSELLRRISLPKNHDEAMPVIGDPLPARQVEAISRWIADGAVWPSDFVAGPHWSYVTPSRPALPPASGNPQWPRNAIDHFILMRLQEEGLQPSVEATPATLVRRLHFDLIGLPPRPDVVNNFAAAPSEEAYRRIVDELLNRPQFGERWARPWLDLARYADSHGFQRDNLRQIWAYRDWVIKALNAGMPFDQFTMEQIAGDLFPEATEEQKIATGFHRCTPTNVEAGSLPEETRIEQVIDRVNTTGAVWLGTTLECAQCHDHKYDPFSQDDYYRLLAFYNSTEAEAARTNPKTPSSIQFRGPKMPLSDPAREAHRKQLEQHRDALQQKLDERRQLLTESLEAWSQTLADELAAAPQTHVLDVVDFQSLGTTDTFDILEDGSVLLTGTDPPDQDTYRVTVRTDLRQISAIRLDCLTDPSLPGSGPGRGDSQRPNFVLTHFSATLAEDGSSAEQPLQFQSAKADVSQANWNVEGALVERNRTGWAIAPHFGKPHWAQFVLKEPLELNGRRKLKLELRHQFGGARSIGRFRLSAITGNVNAETIPAQIAALCRRLAADWSKKDRQTLLDFRSDADKSTMNLKAALKTVSSEIEELAPETTLVMIELPQPRESYVFERGDYRNKGHVVSPGTPKILHDIPDGPPNRLTLARWLVDENNPLTARVTVNRWWAEIFGRGIVSTPEDFGIKGEQPSHPLLLDWLAVEFMDSGWDMKHILRTIVLSSTYRQSSAVTPELLARDDRNQWLGRGPVFRMDAEMIRDNVLSFSGLLNLKPFGPPIRPWQPPGIWSKVGGEAYDYQVSPGFEQHRRGVYVVLKRGAPYPSFTNFDASARLACTVQRSRTNTPLQALTLLNDPVYVEAAAALARRVLTERRTDSIEHQLAYAFQLCTARLPDDREAAILLDLLATQSSVNRGAEPDATGKDEPAGVDPADFDAWCTVAAALINLHETITKN